MTSIPKHPKIAIIGSGAVGGYYGARLVQHGHDVHFLLRSDFDVVKTNGWIIESLDGDFNLPADRIHIYDQPEKMPAADLVIITLKTTANDQFKNLIEPVLKDSTAILTLQNGLGNEEELARLFGAQRILGGMAFTCINRIAPGHIRHTDHGMIRLGEFTESAQDRAHQIADIFNSSGIHCRVLDDLRYGRWEKLVWNIPFNGLGAALDLTTDRLLATAGGTGLVRQIMEEVVATAASIGIRLPTEIIDQKIEQTRTMGAYHTSMQIDRQQRRPLEIEAIITRPLSIASDNGVHTPNVQMLNQLLSAYF